MAGAYKPVAGAIERYIINDAPRGHCLRLDKNEFNFPFPDDLLEKIKGSVSNYLIQAYPSTHRTGENAAQLLEHDNPNQILLTPGADYALKVCYESFLNQGDKVVLQSPTYAMNDVYAKIAGAEQVLVEHNADLSFNLGEFIDQAKLANMAILTNPNQPTGNVFSLDQVREACEVCLQNGVWLIVDEAYHAFSGVTCKSLIGEYSNLIVVRSFSKSYGIAGLRVGAILSQEENIHYLNKFMPVYSVNAFSLGILDVLVEYQSYFRDMHQSLCVNRDRIQEYFLKQGAMPFESHTNFVMVETGDKFSAAEYVSFLAKNNILIRGPWTRPPFKDAFRVTVSTEENINELCRVSDEFFRY